MRRARSAQVERTSPGTHETGPGWRQYVGGWGGVVSAERPTRRTPRRSGPARRTRWRQALSWR